jgi:hypothetical protein
MSEVTVAQRAMLELLCVSTNARAQGYWWDGPDMLVYLRSYHVTTQGVHQTAASLVRRGLVEKARHRGQVIYRISGKGREMVAALRSLDARRTRTTR